MIVYNAEKRQFVLSTRKTTMVLRHGEEGLYNLYWGGTIRAEDIEAEEKWFHSSFDPDLWQERQEFSSYNGRTFTQPVLIAGEKGQNALFFRFETYHVEDNSLLITLREPHKRLELLLEYTVYEEFDIIGRRATLKNNGGSLDVQRFFSGCFTLPLFRGECLRYLTGKWAGECQIQDRELAPGTIELQSMRGIPGPHFNPSLALHEHAMEEAGDVWFGLLAYSGNWKICVEQTAFGNTNILAGRNDFDGAEILPGGTALSTPMFYGGFSANGFGGMSRLLHSFQISQMIRTPEVRPVLYNSWEATAFAVNVESQKKLARRAAEMGVELFVVDDGWFGQRHSDTAGLGDWEVNKEKFPGGLEELIDEVKSLNMAFGIWVEPEAVNPDSNLYRSHPDWIYHIPGAEPMTARNQYVLDFSLPQVKAYVKEFLGKLLSRHDIQYLKWDMNRAITDVAGEDATGNGKKRRAHVEALYEIWAWLRETFPHVALESCSGGGGRAVGRVVSPGVSN
ncbi:MAG TPA: alpha-galactosidase [Clostridiales bacterium]|nr:alpha-galactosidase [Clostridiales bacterium]